MDAAYKWRKQIKATAADDGLHMPTKGAENRKTVCESLLRSTPSPQKKYELFLFRSFSWASAKQKKANGMCTHGTNVAEDDFCVWKV